ARCIRNPLPLLSQSLRTGSFFHRVTRSDNQPSEHWSEAWMAFRRKLARGRSPTFGEKIPPERRSFSRLARIWGRGLSAQSALLLRPEQEPYRYRPPRARSETRSGCHPGRRTASDRRPGALSAAKGVRRRPVARTNRDCLLRRGRLHTRRVCHPG